MRKGLYLLLMCFFIFEILSAQDSIKIKRPKFVSFQIAEGLLLPSSKMVEDKTKTSNVFSLNLKYGFLSKGDAWEDVYYGMPYWGMGVYKPFYSMHNVLGDPFSVYLFQGATLKTFHSGASLNYEINLGVSFHWNHFDQLYNPHFRALGSSVNAHLGGNIYLKKPISSNVDLTIGLDFLHFSNGSLRTPNYGLNSVSAMMGLAYHLNERPIINAEKTNRLPISFEKRTVHDFSFYLTSRTVNIDTVDTNLRSKCPDRRFQVVGLNYACMWHQTRRFMWGPGVELLYDEGSKACIYGEVSEVTGAYREVVQLGKVADRFALGLSLKGELVMPKYSIFANLGYHVRHPGREKRLYQIYGAKVHFTEGLSASLAVKSNNLTRSQFLYISIGYSFYKYRKK